MASNVNITKATVRSVRTIKTKTGGTMLSLSFQWWERDRDEFVGNFGNLAIFNAGDLQLNSGDKVNLKNMKLKFTDSPKWVQVKAEDRFDEEVEANPARFADFTMFATDKEGGENVEIVERGDPTGKPKSKPKAAKPKLPITDHDDDDLPF